MNKIASVDLSQFVGVNLGSVTLVKLLRHGSMGAVFIGYQATLKRQVAVKILPKSIAGSTKARRMFRDEAETVGILSHPNIVPVYEMGESDGFYYQVMQFVPGHDLRAILVNLRKHPVPTKRIIPFAETCRYIMQILDALGYAHEEGVYHQDVKPANILIDERLKRPLVADFGICRTLWAEYGDTARAIGTPLYTSPEQARCEEVDGRTDIYSTGVMLMEMATGVLAVHNEPLLEMLKRKRSRPETFFKARPSAINPAIDHQLEMIICKATDPLPQNRFTDCREFRGALENLMRAAGSL